MAADVIQVRLVLKNKKAIKAMAFVTETLEELQEDFPYRPEIKKAIKAMIYAVRSLDAESV